jgi:iron(II)-dependent oxidoreductase
MAADVQTGALALTGSIGVLFAWIAPAAEGSWCGYALAGTSAAVVAGRWAFRCLRRGTGMATESGDAGNSDHGATGKVASSNCHASSGRPAANPTDVDFSDEGSLVNHMLSQHRYAILLRPQVAANLRREHVELALSELDQHMSLVPSGDVILHPWRPAKPEESDDPHEGERLVSVEALFLDRYPITNRQYFDFVASGAYEQPAIWDPEILNAVVEFVDKTGHPGPRYWENGHYPIDEDDLPVVGVSWYEAMAYARWAGKRLPSDAEWVKAASWPVSQPDAPPTQRRFPWGESMDRSMANLWGSGPGCPVSVREYPQGTSVGGASQLIGNVWEWTSSPFGAWNCRFRALELPLPMKSIRGGAFDTYFDNQAQNSFQSGDALCARKYNIGFRCALGVCDVTTILADNPAAEEAQSECCPVNPWGVDISSSDAAPDPLAELEKEIAS